MTCFHSWDIQFCCRTANKVVDALAKFVPPYYMVFRAMLPSYEKIICKEVATMQVLGSCWSVPSSTITLWRVVTRSKSLLMQMRPAGRSQKFSGFSHQNSQRFQLMQLKGILAPCSFHQWKCFASEQNNNNNNNDTIIIIEYTWLTNSI